MIAGLTVGHRVYGPGEPDTHGNATAAWAEPVALLVFSVAPRGSSEPTAARDEVVSGLTLLAPADTIVGPLDLIVIDDTIPAYAGEWKVDGDLGDWTRGPFGYRPGVAINLTRAEG